MAVTVTRTIPDALDAKIKDNAVGWGTQAQWWDWVKAQTRQEITNRRLRGAAADSEAALAVVRAQILGDDATMTG